ncbi:putative pp-loop family protein [Phaeoacremonium minimum UCRPA7]|uniref:tRNA(Ile)-lysidine synthetase n=1 Tax=Phaeoacremonium minimum (strain UCR-PA7) TaxID=1286976 RepID=R8BLR8_PHAM7|nr:putative pp-loop family protein [Phaeoacremonium minimum UCRPA7]EOO00321.1 putative pp-loop family protein [Phaeoacremonium minimum UCRPA7]
MTSIPRVFHPTAKPIAVAEFIEAVRATCPPRFPLTRGQNRRPVGLAVSGGVDSMALALLCSQARRSEHDFKIADHPVNHFQALIVDHGMREGSWEEAAAVRKVLEDKTGIRAELLRIQWSKELGYGVAPKDLPNFESVARRLRFRRLGRACNFRKLASLLLAHHEDDQYETVLMRLLAGHGPAGLRGIRASSDIPECYNMHGTYASGFIDDQERTHPYYNSRPSRKEKQYLREELTAEVGPETMHEIQQGLKGGLYLNDELDEQTPRTRWLPQLGPLDIEDGGVMVYRPLLEFSKDRLIATCLEADVPWFEDATNHDRTLTVRNAVRHLYKNHELPVALQKPSILQLRKRCDDKAFALDAEVDKLLGRTIIRDFQSNIGTLLVQLPTFRVPRLRKGSIYNQSRREIRNEHYRALAARLVRRLISFVTPEFQVTPAAQLQQVVIRLFPHLDDGNGESHSSEKAFNICGVHFLPVYTSSSRSLNWFLSRAPYLSTVPLPQCQHRQYRLREHWLRRNGERLSWPSKSPWKMFDGRFWIKVYLRAPFGVRVAPFMKEHAKPFREALADDASRDALASLLKRYAPGKVRYTLPAIYGIGNIDWSLYGENPNLPEAGTRWEKTRAKEKEIIKRIRDGAWDEEIGPKAKLMLLALPTLGVALPGLDQWLQWQISSL